MSGMSPAVRRRLPLRKAWGALGAVLPIHGARRLVVIGALSFVGGLLEAAIIVAIAAVAVAVAEGRTHVDLGFGLGSVAVGTALIAAALALLGRLSAEWLVARATSRLLARSLVELSRRLFRGYLARPWTAQTEVQQGHLEQYARSFADETVFAVRAIATGSSYAFTILALLVAAFVVDAVAASITFLVVAVLAAVFRPLARVLHGLAHERAGLRLALANQMAETVGLAKEVKVFGVDDALAGRVEATLERLEEHDARSHFISLLLPSLHQIAALALLLAGLAVVTTVDVVDLAALGAVVLLTLRVLSQSQVLQNTYQQLCERAAYAELIADRLREDAGHRERVEGRPLTSVDRLELRDATYAYPGGAPVLRAFSFVADRGEIVGLTGPSGSGKTTIVEVLVRLRDLDLGRYLVNGEQADRFSLVDWRRRFALVPQETVLLRGSVAENIAFLRPEVDHAAVVAAARMANIHDDVESWRDGYGTQVGERGRSISGGQRQRIAIARALAGRPDVLVLDEPTSALDFDAEALVTEALERLKGTMTVVVVAHRPSTLRRCDRVVTLGATTPAAAGALDARALR
jgi:ATP-binding cassette, subfamily B, bacterial